MDTDSMRDFLTQAFSGPIIAFKRLISVGRIDAIPPEAYGNIMRAQLANYFNGCYKSLLKDDDDYVTTTFKKWEEHSPICLLHIFMALAQKILPTEEPFPGNPGGIDATRELVHGVLRAQLGEELGDVQKYFGHHCTGPNILAMREEWESQGRPDEDFFILKRRNGSECMH
eukprot:gnl/Trimastix_PCT/2848.p1 GENE.gnl/Trimastix_PCT/2848~~gnl/Trimastix_PCT/2848.p1  ORF type:complete len:171 (+),score=9.23 gnl/Trimastix_PCT/2848:84-596(+)